MNDVIPDLIRDPTSFLFFERIGCASFKGSWIPDQVRDDVGKWLKSRLILSTNMSEFAQAA